MFCPLEADRGVLPGEPEQPNVLSLGESPIAHLIVGGFQGRLFVPHAVRHLVPYPPEGTVLSCTSKGHSFSSFFFLRGDPYLYIYSRGFRNHGEFQVSPSRYSYFRGVIQPLRVPSPLYRWSVGGEMPKCVVMQDVLMHEKQLQP